MTADLVAFLNARCDDDVAAIVRNYVIISGGTPNPLVPNCLYGEGSCRWQLKPAPERLPWWTAAIREHNRTHLDDKGRRQLADIAAKRRIIDEYVDLLKLDTDRADDHGIHGQRLGVEFAVRHLGSVYADHADYQPEWKP